MKNNEIIRHLEEVRDNTNDEIPDADEQYLKFLIFRINDRMFAFYTGQVREIVMHTPLFFIPFVPPYVRGLINRYGEPYTVIDVHVLMENRELETSTFLILNKKEDQVAFIISEILEIVKISVSGIHQAVPGAGAGNISSTFIKEAFVFQEKEIFILDADTIINRLEADIAAAG